MIKIYLYIIALGVIVFIAYDYSKAYVTYEKATENRSKYQEAIKKDDVKIAVVWPEEGTSFFSKGAMAALKVINDTKFITYKTDDGSQVSKTLSLVFFSENNEAEGLANAKVIGRDPTFAAVIGHYSSTTSIPASISYEYNGIPYISPVATSILLTQHNFGHVFRNAPTDNDFSNALIKFCHKKKLKNVAVIYCRDTYGINFSNIFVESAAGLNTEGETETEPINITIQKSYSPNQTIFLSLVADVIETNPDCIFLAGLLPQAGQLIRQIRQMGIRIPIIGGDGIDASDLTTHTGKFTGEIYVASVFDRLARFPEGSIYEEASTVFKNLYVTEPDYEASQGMEAVFILAQAIKLTQSTNPQTITSFLKVYENFDGISGKIRFSKDGNIIGKDVFIKELKDGQFNKLKSKGE